MTKALREDKLDVAVVLTEGIVAEIIRGNPSKLLGTYVSTPLSKCDPDSSTLFCRARWTAKQALC